MPLKNSFTVRIYANERCRTLPYAVGGVTLNDYQRFGAFLKDKRNEREISIRPMAEQVNISAGHYCDIESGRRSPADREFLDTVIGILHLNDEDKQAFYDLWGKARSASPPDLIEYINGSKAARIALRVAKDKASDADWQRFVNQLEGKE
jgi:transcriptional regulator with XRE-family HTH domain